MYTLLDTCVDRFDLTTLFFPFVFMKFSSSFLQAWHLWVLESRPRRSQRSLRHQDADIPYGGQVTAAHLMVTMLNSAVSIFLCTCDERNSAHSIAGCPSCALVLFSRNWTGIPTATWQTKILEVWHSRLVEPLKLTCTTKVKANSVKQEYEKQDELKRSLGSHVYVGAITVF